MNSTEFQRCVVDYNIAIRRDAALEARFKRRYTVNIPCSKAKKYFLAFSKNVTLSDLFKIHRYIDGG
jgi:hypothetical protein